jgi:hypothetical protein
LVDESRIAGHDLVGSEPPSFQRRPAQVRNENVGTVEELERKRLTFGRSQIDSE